MREGRGGGGEGWGGEEGRGEEGKGGEGRGGKERKHRIVEFGLPKHSTSCECTVNPLTVDDV